MCDRGGHFACGAGAVVPGPDLASINNDDEAAQRAFGSHLRHQRLRRAVTLEAIARATNVPVTLWEELEEGALASWPNGVAARGWVADYARLVSLDPDETIDDFCRAFPQGDRRRGRIVDRLADTVGHQPAVWTDEWHGEERRASLHGPRDEQIASRRETIISTCVEVAIAIVLGALVSAATGIALSLAVLASGVVYFAFSTAAGTPIGTRLRQVLPRRLTSLTRRSLFSTPPRT